MGKTERSPIGFIAFVLKFEELKNPLAKMVDLMPLGAFSGPGAPDPDFALFHVRVTPMEDRWNTPTSGKFNWFY